MSDVLIGLAEVQSTMLITDINRAKIIRAMSEIKKLQAENAELEGSLHQIAALAEEGNLEFYAVCNIINDALEGE